MKQLFNSEKTRKRKTEGNQGEEDKGKEKILDTKYIIFVSKELEQRKKSK